MKYSIEAELPTLKTPEHQQKVEELLSSTLKHYCLEAQAPSEEGVKTFRRGKDSPSELQLARISHQFKQIDYKIEAQKIYWNCELVDTFPSNHQERLKCIVYWLLGTFLISALMTMNSDSPDPLSHLAQTFLGVQMIFGLVVPFALYGAKFIGEQLRSQAINLVESIVHNAQYAHELSEES